MGYLTANKPKALISINNEPLIIRTIKLFPKAKILIISDYKSDLLKKYLSIYSPTDNYEIVKTHYKFDGGGIKQCLRKIPSKTPFLLIWCDLYLENANFINKLSSSTNYIGLSNQFKCRWSFQRGLPVEQPSKRRGIIGLFVFKDKKALSNIPNETEFCKFLRNDRVAMVQFYPEGIKEIGTLHKYSKFCNASLVSRAFNRIEVEKGILKKIPVNKQGMDLALLEKKWYQSLESYKIDFLPRILSYDPLTMKFINGKPLYEMRMSLREKNNILKKIIEQIRTIHVIKPTKKQDYHQNNDIAFLSKTKERMTKIASLIPLIDQDYIMINGKKCINVYKNFKIVEDLIKPYYSNDYKVIHGDITFSNIIFSSDSRIVFIDPRGYFGKEILFGDEDYDWAKLYYSIIGDYDQFNRKNFRLTIDDNNISIKISSSGWHKLEKQFFKLINRDIRKIKIIHAIIWLSLTSYTWDNYDSICGAFYKGVYLINDILEDDL